VAAELGHAGFEAHPGAGRGLLEDHRQGLARERVAEALWGGLDLGGETEQALDLPGREVVDRDQVSWAHGRVVKGAPGAGSARTQGTIAVPASPSSAWWTWSMSVMTTRRPVAATKSTAASILGPMLPGRELPLGLERPRLGQAEDRQVRLAIGAEVALHAGDVGEDQEELGLQLPGEERRGAVLVDHRLDPCRRPPRGRPGCRRRRRRSPPGPARGAPGPSPGRAPPADAGTAPPCATPGAPASSASRTRAGRPRRSRREEGADRLGRPLEAGVEASTTTRERQAGSASIASRAKRLRSASSSR
jgi:hypothetical protein